MQKLIFKFFGALLLKSKEPFNQSLCTTFRLVYFDVNTNSLTRSQLVSVKRWLDSCQPINLVDSFLPLYSEWRKHHLHLQRYWISKLQFLQPTNLSPPILLWGGFRQRGFEVYCGCLQHWRLPHSSGNVGDHGCVSLYTLHLHVHTLLVQSLLHSGA